MSHALPHRCRWFLRGVALVLAAGFMNVVAHGQGQVGIIAARLFNPQGSGGPPGGPGGGPSGQTADVRIQLIREDQSLFLTDFVSVPPGQTVEWSHPVGVEDDPGDFMVVSVSRPEGYLLVGNSYVATSAPSYVAVFNGSPTLRDAESDPSTWPEFQVDPSTEPLGTPNAAKTVWVIDDTTLTADLFREGVDKVVYAVNSSGSGGGGGGGGGSNPLTEELSEFQLELAQDIPAEAVMTGYGEQVRQWWQQTWGVMPQPVVPNAPAGFAPDFSVTLPSGLGGFTFDLNPFRSDRFGSTAAWVKSLISWVLQGHLALWLITQLRQITQGFTMLPQAKGNAIAGGTGAQATALAAAGLITAAIATGVVALLAWQFGTFSFSSALAQVWTDPLSTIPGNVLWMIEQVFPIVTALAVFLARVSFQSAIIPVFGTVAGIIRFVVP